MDGGNYAEGEESPHELLSLTYQDDLMDRQIKEESRDDSETDEEPWSPHSLAFAGDARSTCSYFSNHSPTTSSNVPDESSIFNAGSNQQTYDQTTLHEDEFDLFGKYIATQLRQLPLKNALEMQIKIMQLITNERLKVIQQNKRNGLIIENGDESEHATSM